MSAYFLPDIKVLHTNCFCQYNESVFPFLNLLAARNGVFFCILLFLSYFCLEAMTKHIQRKRNNGYTCQKFPTFMMSLVPDLPVFEVSEV